MIPIIDTLLGTLAIALPIMVVMYIDEVIKKMRELRAKIMLQMQEGQK
jgi:hypothetical protein